MYKLYTWTIQVILRTKHVSCIPAGYRLQCWATRPINVFFSVVFFTPPHPSHHGSVWLVPVISLLLTRLAYPYDLRGFEIAKKKTSVGLLVFNPLWYWVSIIYLFIVTCIYMNLLCLHLLRPEIKYLMPYDFILHSSLAPWGANPSWSNSGPSEWATLHPKASYTAPCGATLHPKASYTAPCGATLHPTELRYTLWRVTLHPTELRTALRCTLLS
jgi:hypothetical protein